MFPELVKGCPNKSQRHGSITMNYYSNDPREIKTKFPSSCATCGCKLPKGVNVYYWPSSRKIYCLACGDEDYRQFLSLAADEEVMNGTGNPYCGC